MNVVIRPGTASDLPFLWEMLYESIHTEPGEPRPPRAILAEPAIAHYLAGWGRPGDHAVVAEAEGVPVGAAWCRLLTGEDPGYGYVADEIPELGMALLPQYRGQGIGTALLGHLVAAAEQAGYPGLSLSVDPRNRVRRLYERLGFVLVASDPGGSWTMVRRFGLDQAGR